MLFNNDDQFDGNDQRVFVKLVGEEGPRVRGFLVPYFCKAVIKNKKIWVAGDARLSISLGPSNP